MVSSFVVRRPWLVAIAGFFLLANICGATLARAEPFLIFFDKQRADITPAAKQILGFVKDKVQPSSRVTIAGHSDNSEAGPDKLSLARATQVQKALVALRLPAGAKISVIGKGAAEPRVPTGRGVAEPQNRRVEITVE